MNKSIRWGLAGAGVGVLVTLLLLLLLDGSRPDDYIFFSMVVVVLGFPLSMLISPLMYATPGLNFLLLGIPLMVLNLGLLAALCGTLLDRLWR